MEPARVLGIPSERGLAAWTLCLLGAIDELPSGATGALRFGEGGVVLVESRRICWAQAKSMRLRLTDILCNQANPPIARDAIEDVVRGCRTTGHPLGESLVASGLVSETGLRSALREHTTHAVAHLARERATADAFSPHTQRGYDPRYAFTTCEILATVCGADDPPRSATAERELAGVLVTESTGAAFVRGALGSGAMLVAADPACDVPVDELVAAGNWATGLLDVAAAFEPEVRVVRVAWCSRTALVTWRKYGVDYVALCSSSAAAARLVSELGKRQHQHGTPPPESLTRRIRSP
ncbi:MAG TPA: hypothetical protein VH062_15345 [Polyangiaceae bacterium]|nr:hypothetical protein [Polyangiaceae bacterium]